MPLRFALVLSLVLAGVARAEDPAPAESAPVAEPAPATVTEPAPAPETEPVPVLAEGESSAESDAILDAWNALPEPLPAPAPVAVAAVDRPRTAFEPKLAPFVPVPSPLGTPTPLLPGRNSDDEVAPDLDALAPEDRDDDVALEDEPPIVRLPVAQRPHAGPELLTDIALELGWNAPAGLGARLLRKVEGTSVAIGLGLAVTMWGPKLSFLARQGERFEEGPFWQASLGLSMDGTDEVALAERTVSFNRSAGRTFDAVAGWRLRRAANSYVEFFGGYSFRLRGVALQQPGTDGKLVALDEETRQSLWLKTPGGLVLGADWGILF